MIVVAGATGTLGGKLAAVLATGGEKVRIFARDANTMSAKWGPDVEARSGDVRDGQAVDRAVDGARAVISAVTGFGAGRGAGPREVDWLGNVHLIKAAQAAGVEHFILISVCQAAANHPIELFRMKHRAELELQKSSLAWTIIRPTAYMETWLRLLGAPLLEKGKARIFGKGKNPINFVSASDVARCVEIALREPEHRGISIDVGGPENISMEGIVRRFQDLASVDGKIVHVPLPVMQAMSIGMKPIAPGLASLMRAAVVMDTSDMTWEPERTARAFSLSRTTIAQVMASDYGLVLDPLTPT